MFNVFNNQDVFVSRKHAKNPLFLLFFYNSTSHVLTKHLTVLSKKDAFERNRGIFFNRDQEKWQ